MNPLLRFVLVGAVLLLPVQAALAQAQVSLGKLRQDLVAPWLLTVQGEDRTRLLRINEIAREAEGSYLLNATFGWTDGVQSIVRIELIHANQELRLIVRTSADSLISMRQAADGGFSGSFKPTRGAEKPVRLERLSEDQVQEKVKEASAKAASRAFADEDKDWSVAPTKATRTGRMHAPTPRELPGAKTVRTMELRTLLDQSPPPILIDVLTGDGHRTIRGARWLREAGEAAFGNAERERLRADLEKLSGGRKSAPLVFFCLSSECWLSYNAGLRAIEMGYTNVHWFRGGTAAWQRAGFEMTEAVPYQR